MSILAITFFILGWVYCFVILWLDENFKKFPILFCWFDVFGIACVGLASFWLWSLQPNLTAEFAIKTLAFTFLFALPGMGTVHHILYFREQNKKKPRILQYDTIAKNGRSKRT